MSNRRFPPGTRPRRGLGDLDEFKLAEREELFERLPGIPTPGSELPPALPPGYLVQPSGLNLPEYGVKVQSVFDTRPINAKDWAAYFKVRPLPETGKGNVRIGFPQGYVSVLRKFSFQAVDDFGVFFPDDFCQIDFGINLSTDSYRITNITGMEVDTQVTEKGNYPTQVIDQEIHLIIPDGEFLTVMISGTGGKNYTFELYGNLIPSKGLPPQLEIASL